VLTDLIAFFLLLYQGITLKKLSLIKRFKSLINGDVSILVAAANMAPEKFEINEDQTKLRALSSAESEDTKPTEDERLENVKGYWLTQNQRSIYAVRLMAPVCV
jgi:SWI/SNF-related matrix-associated actin-dependent regulator of chromatin subfamily A member 5